MIDRTNYISTFSLLILQLCVHTQMTVREGFIQSNNLNLLVDVDDISKIHKGFNNDVRSANIYDSVGNSWLRFEPEFLDFKERPLGVPYLEKVTLYNVNSNKSIDMTSISGNTVHFHSSFFEDKVIPPLGNTTFNVVFLGREEGQVESSLFIHTKEGTFKYQVKGSSVASPYRLRPIVDIRVPLNVSFSPLIFLHNPHTFPIQVSEVYSSGGDFHLELPTGELEGPKDMWEIPPFQTKPVIRVRFNAKVESNYTAYVRIKVSNVDDILVVPLEVEVTSQHNIYTPQGTVDFGIGSTLEKPKNFKLKLYNTMKKLIKIHSVTTSSKAIKIDFKPVKLSPEQKDATEIASLTVDWKKAFETKDFFGKISIKYQKGKSVLDIPYWLTVFEGGIFYNDSVTKYLTNGNPIDTKPREFIVTNKYKFPLAVMNISVPKDAHLYFSIKKFKPLILKPNESLSIFTIVLKNSQPNQNFDHLLEILTNVTKLKITVQTYDGKLSLILPNFSSVDNPNIFDLGLVSADSQKVAYFLLKNENPIDLEILNFGASTSFCKVSFEGKNRDNERIDVFDPRVVKKGKKVGESKKGITNLSGKSKNLKPGEYGIFKIAVDTKNRDGLFNFQINIQSKFEINTVHVKLKVSQGHLEISPEKLIFDNCFPGKICSAPLKIMSTFTEPMIIEKIEPFPADLRLSSSHQGHITSRSNRNVGNLYLNPALTCSNDFSNQHCYTGFPLTQEIVKNFQNSKVTDIDYQILTTLYSKYQNSTKSENITLKLETSEVKSYFFKSKIHLVWPKIVVNLQNFSSQNSPKSSQNNKNQPANQNCYKPGQNTQDCPTDSGSRNGHSSQKSGHNDQSCIKGQSCQKDQKGNINCQSGNCQKGCQKGSQSSQNGSQNSCQRVQKGGQGTGTQSGCYQGGQPNQNGENGQNFQKFSHSLINFPLTQIGQFSFQNITVKNPSDKILAIQLFMDFPHIRNIEKILPNSFFPTPDESIDSTSFFFLENRTFPHRKNFENTLQIVSNKNSIPLLLKPQESADIVVGFKATVSNLKSAIMYIRNNLTALEIVKIQGQGASPNFKFGNRRPGSGLPLLFELTEKHLRDCDKEKGRKNPMPNLTVKRSFTARNSGDLPIFIDGFLINGFRCEGYGFKVLNCGPFELPPNSTKKVEIAFTPDFTLSKIQRTLILETSLDIPVNFTLVTTIPPYYLTPCANVLGRPNWEPLLYYTSIILMSFLLFIIISVIFIESDRILRQSVLIHSQSSEIQTLDLRLIGTQTRNEIQKIVAQEQEKVENSKNQLGYKMTPPSTGYKITPPGTPTVEISEKPTQKTLNCENFDLIIPSQVTRAQKKKVSKKNSLDSQLDSKKRNVKTDPVTKKEKTTKKSQKSIDASKKPQKSFETLLSEEDTSSTTTESSNNEDPNGSQNQVPKDKKGPLKRSKSTSSTLENWDEQVEPEKEATKKDSNNKKSLENKVSEKKSTLKAQSANGVGSSSKKDPTQKIVKKKNNLGVAKILGNDGQKSLNSNSGSGSGSNSVLVNQNVWTKSESKLTFSEVCSQNSTNIFPVSKITTQKPTLYVEPTKIKKADLGPIGSKKLGSQNSPNSQNLTDFGISKNMSFFSEPGSNSSSKFENSSKFGHSKNFVENPKSFVENPKNFTVENPKSSKLIDNSKNFVENPKNSKYGEKSKNSKFGENFVENSKFVDGFIENSFGETSKFGETAKSKDFEKSNSFMENSNFSDTSNFFESIVENTKNFAEASKNFDISNFDNLKNYDSSRNFNDVSNTFDSSNNFDISNNFDSSKNFENSKTFGDTSKTFDNSENFVDISKNSYIDNTQNLFFENLNNVPDIWGTGSNMKENLDGFNKENEEIPSLSPIEANLSYNHFWEPLCAPVGDSNRPQNSLSNDFYWNTPSSSLWAPSPWTPQLNTQDSNLLDSNNTGLPIRTPPGFNCNPGNQDNERQERLQGNFDPFRSWNSIWQPPNLTNNFWSGPSNNSSSNQ